ncbi:Aspartic proteinase PCS1 [Ananas comosus]|uniref:Aspartic proteinase PCS1 n=1 Tax=Ananas comosus TaxID=4615 RepID=A0A199UH89_ANACO|nr:Aspartic proteinase PCS1 [Ananas comosus]
MGSSLPPSYTLLFPCLPLLLFIILAQPCTSLAWTTPTTATATTYDAGRKTKPVILPLRAQKVASLPLPRQPNKLLFHHNVSLTVSLAVGAPPQNVSMVLDTGSELSWLLCNTSSSPNSFNLLASSSYRPLPCSSPACQSQARDLPVPPSCDPSSNACRVSLSYADASSSEGSLAADSFLLGRPPPLRTVFGCIFSSYDSSAAAAATHGLLGMNRGALSFVTRAPRAASPTASPTATTPGSPPRGRRGLRALRSALDYTPLIEISLRSPTSTASPTRSSSRASAWAPRSSPSPSPCSPRTTRARAKPWWTRGPSSPSSSATPTTRSRSNFYAKPGRSSRRSTSPTSSSKARSTSASGSQRRGRGRGRHCRRDCRRWVWCSAGGAEGERGAVTVPGGGERRVGTGSGAPRSGTPTWCPCRPTSLATTTSRTSGSNTTSTTAASASPPSAATSPPSASPRPSLYDVTPALPSAISSSK